MEKSFDFEVIGIAEAIKRDRLKVPPNQREYSWVGEIQVQDLLHDIAKAIRNGKQEYFLGTIVLKKLNGDFLEIEDGQQRLATTTMILAAIRDFFEAKNDTIVVQGIEDHYLFTIDIKAREKIPRLTLNLDDNEFFRNSILLKKSERAKMIPTRRSHRLIEQASNEILNYFSLLEKQVGPSNIKDELIGWLDFLKEKANVVKLCVSTSSNAFKLFETLNDRGLRISQADLVKNYLFGKSDERLAEAQRHWSSMRGAVESIGDENDLTMEFLRSVCCIMSGATRERDVMDRVETYANSKNEAIKLLVSFDELSKDYSAILNQDHPKWNGYDKQIRKSIQTIGLLSITQIRPLMLAVARFFSKEDAVIAFRKMVAWSVRFIILGMRGGRLDEGYSRLANCIFKGEIKTSEDLKAAASAFIISDAQFKKAFDETRVGVAKLARYYLRSLETTARGQLEPEFIPNDDLVINLEHIMPSSTNDDWKDATTQDIETHFGRLGNMVLLQAKKNSLIGSSSFDQKKKEYKKSNFLLTSQVAELDNWSIEQIENRQKILAELAVKTWSL